jgi:hypothetical protein
MVTIAMKNDSAMGRAPRMNRSYPVVAQDHKM